MDMAGSPSARAVKRIEDVRVLRTAQFPEDAGPMAHPVRPDSYLEINNFYTVTVYEKGAEVVRMMQTLVGNDTDPSGRAGFAAGMKLYFQRHDGQAVTCDDFAQAVADANPGSPLAQHLPQFKRWYAQAGTPRVNVSSHFDSESRTCALTLRQSCPATPGQPEKAPFVIPLTLGLLSADGQALPVRLQGEAPAQATTTRTFVLTEASQTLVFEGLDAAPVPSLLRGFSAPVVLEQDFTDDQLLTLLANDEDPFNRWEAGQRLALRIALQWIASNSIPSSSEALNDAYLNAMRSMLQNPALDPAFKELVLTLPAETYMAEQLEVVDPQRIHAVREAMREALALGLQAEWEAAFQANQPQGYTPDAASSGQRALANQALAMLCLAATLRNDPVWPGKALQRFKDASNMTDRFGAVSALVLAGHPLAQNALERFHALFKDEALVIDKWFALQAGTTDRGGQVLSQVRRLMAHPDFNIKNPNRARSVISTYCQANPAAFHRADAAGYVFWSEQVVELDSFNPQVAARLARGLDRWKKLAEPYRSAAREAIARVAARNELSNDVREVVTRALAD